MGDICLNTTQGPFLQLLDYEGVPFRCHQCHALDHLVAQCSFTFQGGKQKEDQGGRVKEHGLHKKPSTHPSKRLALSEQDREAA